MTAKIWNFAPLVDEKKEADAGVHKLLCSLSHEPNSVNCVKWSKCGSFLATGADGGTVMIWYTPRAIVLHGEILCGGLNISCLQRRFDFGLSCTSLPVKAFSVYICGQFTFYHLRL